MGTPFLGPQEMALSVPNFLGPIRTISGRERTSHCVPSSNAQLSAVGFLQRGTMSWLQQTHPMQQQAQCGMLCEQWQIQE